MKFFRSGANDSFDRFLRDQTPEQIEKILPALRSLNSPSYKQPLNPDTAQLAHLIAGRPDELVKYLKERDAYAKANGTSSPTRVVEMNRFLVDQNKHFKKIAITSDKAKTNLITSAWRLGTEQGFKFGTNQFVNGTRDPSRDRHDNKYGIEWLAGLGNFSAQEILELGPTLAEINSVNGEIWLQLARRQAKAGQNSEAAESFKKSIEDAKDDMKKAKFNRRVEYANVLVKLKRNEEAKKLIEGVPAKDLFKANKETLKKLQERLK